MAQEFAPGIPDKDLSHELPNVSDPEEWQFALQHHLAEKAGEHLDLRLGDLASGWAHSWALKYWPKPGERRRAIKQSTHSLKYMDFEGQIHEGYGKGDVKLVDREKMEVLKSSPNKITFNVYKGRDPHEYALIRKGNDDWLLINRTISRDRYPDLPDDKPPYVDRDIDIENPQEVLQAKIDGAHNLVVFPKSGSYPKFVSYRPGKRAEGGIIEHTHKIPDFSKLPIPPHLRDSIVRGEIYAKGPTGKAIKSHELGALLNSGIWNSRAKQEGAQSPLKTVLFDVVRHRGRDVSQEPYRRKLSILEEIIQDIPYFELPPMARTPKEKKKLFEDIVAGRVPETEEGVVAWNMEQYAPAARIKIRPDYDVYIREFYDARPGTKYEGNAVGGFLYSHEPDGPIVGRVGAGLSDKLRRKMYENPGSYTGAVATVTAQGKFKSGALRAPSFSEWHLDKNDLEFLKYAEFMDIKQLIGALAADLIDGALS